MQNLGLGREVDPLDAKPGDFVVFHRTSGIGHSVVFLEWVRHDGVVVGFRYRSSQIGTDGVGDVDEYFTTSRYKGATVNPNQFFVGRLK
jgi:hypothetical protein